MTSIEIRDNISISTISSADEDAYYRFGDDDGGNNDGEKTVAELPGEHKRPSASVIPSMAGGGGGGGGPTIERIGIETSTDVTIGNQTYFQGPVIIKNLTTSNSDHADKRFSTEKFAIDEVNEQSWKSRKKRMFIISILLVAVLLIGLIGLIVLLQSPPDEPSDPTTTTTMQTSTQRYSSSSTTTNTPPTTTTEPTTTSTFKPMTILPRESWTNREVWSPSYRKMPHPIVEIFLSDTGRFGYWLCDTYSKCEEDAKDLEAHLDVSYPFGGLQFNFMIPNIEMIFEGRGWTFDGVFSNTDLLIGHEMLFVVMMGNFNEFAPTELQMYLLWSLIDDGIENGYVDPDYRVYAECQGPKGSLASPGLEWLHTIREMERWSNESDVRELRDCKR